MRGYAEGGWCVVQPGEHQELLCESIDQERIPNVILALIYVGSYGLMLHMEICWTHMGLMLVIFSTMVIHMPHPVFKSLDLSVSYTYTNVVLAYFWWNVARKWSLARYYKHPVCDAKFLLESGLQEATLPKSSQFASPSCIDSEVQ